MPAAKSPPKRWLYSHDPEERPLGCNGRWGSSGSTNHINRAEAVCPKCRKSAAHYQRERRRGGIKPRKLQPCGTHPAYERHRAAGEEACFKCQVAEANYRAELRAKNP